MMYLQIQGYPEREGRKWRVILYIRDSTAFVGWKTIVVSHKFLDACRVAAHDAIKKICSTYHGMVQRSPMRFFPPMNKIAPAWRKRTVVLTEIRASKDPTLAYLA